MDFTFLSEYYKYFLNGAVITLFLSFLGVIFGLIGGTLLAIMKLSHNKISKGIATVYVEFIRGTPILVQVLLVYLSVPKMSMFVAGVISLAVNSSAYVAEIIRAGINAVDKGQTEAAKSLGMSDFLAFREVIFPQAIKNILPALGNEFVVLIKESSIVSVIGAHELMYNASTIQGITFSPQEPLIVVSIMYFALTFTVSRFMAKIERRLKVSD
jgi:polar amino acid transport system permease protein